MIERVPPIKEIPLTWDPCLFCGQTGRDLEFPLADCGNCEGEGGYPPTYGSTDGPPEKPIRHLRLMK